MDLMPSEEQEEIASTVAALLAERLPLIGRGATFVDDGSGIDAGVWSTCCELGWLSLGLSADLGGVGYGVAEEIMLFRELGRGVAPGPFLPGVLAVHLAAAVGDGPLVDRLVDGSAMVALGTPVGDRQIGDTVVGDVSLVHVAEAELVLVCDVGGAALVDVADVRVERLDPVDGAVPIGRGRIDDAAAIAYLPSDATALRGVPIHDRGLVLAAATAAGVAAGATAVAVEYAKQREQFGKPIGAFQAIKHRCADMAVAAEGAFAQTCYAAVALRDGVTGAGTEAAVAKYHADVAAQLAASGAVQVHGAIGFTSEALPHRYVYRANLLRTLLSGRAELLDRVLDRPAEVT